MDNRKKILGVMIDCSRDAVMNVTALKRFIDVLSRFGYNMLQLYTEDTYEVQDEPYFGYLRGRYTGAELKEIDNFARSKGIELVPCIQTLAHLNQIMFWPEYRDVNDCNDILLVDNERTYQLIENMFKTLKENFTSNKVNIGMDEAHMLGLGKYLDKHGYKNRFDIILKHLKIVCEIATKYGFKPMMWSDMFFRLANKGNYYVSNKNISEEIINTVPKEVDLVYWDYYSEDENRYDSMLKSHKQFNNDIWFAGGLWSWRGFVPHNNYSIQTTKAAMTACNNNGINNIFVTMWGDNGGECSYFSLLPSLFYTAELSKGNYDDKLIKEKFKKITELDFDEYLNVDLPDIIGKERITTQNPSKYMLYNDFFTGILDSTVKENDKNRYKKYAKILKDFDKSSEYYYIFECYSVLCDCLFTKYDLGVKTRKDYKEKDVESLKTLIKQYTKFTKQLKIFYQKFKELWFKENKPNGFEIHEIRLGGLMLRAESCKARLQDYIDNKIEKIEELEEDILDFTGKGKNYDEKLIIINNYKQSVSVNIL